MSGVYQARLPHHVRAGGRVKVCRNVRRFSPGRLPEPNTFTIDDAMAKMSEMASSGSH